MKNSFRIAFCGLICALSVVLMISTGIIPVATYAFPCFSGILLSAIVIEFGEKWAVGAYVTVSVLSIFLAGDKEAVAYFVAFFGFYPIAKSAIERLKSKAVQYIIKYAVFTVCMVSAFSVCKFVLAIPDEEFTVFGFYVPWAFLAIAEVFFIVYDRCVTILLVRYINTIRNRIFKNPPIN